MSDSISAVSSSNPIFTVPCRCTWSSGGRNVIGCIFSYFIATIFTTLVVGARMEFNFLHNQSAFAVVK